MFSMQGKIKKPFWPIKAFVEETLVDKTFKAIQGWLWHYLSLTKLTYQKSDITDEQAHKLNIDFWAGADVFLAKKLRKQISIIFQGYALDTSGDQNDIALASLASALYAFNGRRVHLITDILSPNSEQLTLMQAYFESLNLSYSTFHGHHNNEAFDAMITAITLDDLMTEYLGELDDFGSPLHLNNLNAAAFKIDRWGKASRKLKGLDVALFPGGKDHLIDRPQWTAIHTTSADNQQGDSRHRYQIIEEEHKLIFALVKVVEQPRYQDIIDHKTCNLEYIKAIREEMPEIKNSWCHDEVLWGWCQRVATVCHQWVEGKDYSIEQGKVVIHTSGQAESNDQTLIQIASIRAGISPPQIGSLKNRITLYRFINLYKTFVVWGSGVACFYQHLWLLYRKLTVTEQFSQQPPLSVFKTESDLLSKLNQMVTSALSNVITVKNVDKVFIVETQLLGEAQLPQNTYMIKAGDIVQPNSLIIALNMSLDPRDTPVIPHGQGSELIHLMTLKHIRSLTQNSQGGVLGEADENNAADMNLLSKNKSKKTLLFNGSIQQNLTEYIFTNHQSYLSRLFNRIWLSKVTKKALAMQLNRKKIIVEQEQKMTSSIDITSSTSI